MSDFKVAVSSDPYRGLFAPYKKQQHGRLPGDLAFGHPGKAGFPEKRSVSAPSVRGSVATDRKKTNAHICYTRVTPLDSQRAAGGTESCVFVSRHGTMHTGEGHVKRSLVIGLDQLNERLRADPDALVRAPSNPLDDWRAVQCLRDWSLDGVLLSHRNEANVSDVLNVCVAGPCPTRNVFDPQQVFASDVCFLVLVAELHDAALPTRHFRFQFVPCTCRTFADPFVYEEQLATKPHPLSHEQRRMAVGAWKLGKVLDSAAVKRKDQHTLTVDVRVEWVGWRALRLSYGKSEVGETLLSMAGAPTDSSCELFHWPSLVVQGQPLERPSRASMTYLEKLTNKNAIQDEHRRRASDRGCEENRKGGQERRGETGERVPTIGSKRKRGHSDGPKLLDSPPLSPLREASVNQAEAEAKVLMQSIENKSAVLVFLSNQIQEDPSTRPDWFDDLYSQLTRFSLKHADAIYQIERRGDDHPHVLDNLRDVMYITSLFNNIVLSQSSNSAVVELLGN